MRSLWAGLAATLLLGAVAEAEFEAPGPSPVFDKPTQDGRDWTASMRGYAGYGANAALVGDTDPYFIGDKGAAFVGATLQGSKILTRGPNWKLGVSGRVDGIAYFDGDDPARLDEYDMYAVGGAVFATRDFKVQDRPARAMIAYDYRKEDDNDVEAIGLDVHRVVGRLAVAVSGVTTVDATVTVSNENYGVDFPDPTLDDRDSTRVTVGLGASFALMRGRAQADVHYRYTDNDADGWNWEYDAHQVKAAVAAHLTGDLYGRASLALECRDYNGYKSGFIPAPGRTEQDVAVLELQLLKRLNDRVDLDAYVRHEQYDSNSSWFEGDDTRVGVGVGYRF